MKDVLKKFKKEGFVEFEPTNEEEINDIAKFADGEDIMFYFIYPGREIQTIKWGTTDIKADEANKEAIYTKPVYGDYAVSNVIDKHDDVIFVLRRYD